MTLAFPFLGSQICQHGSEGGVRAAAHSWECRAVTARANDSRNDSRPKKGAGCRPLALPISANMARRSGEVQVKVLCLGQAYGIPQVGVLKARWQ